MAGNVTAAAYANDSVILSTSLDLRATCLATQDQFKLEMAGKSCMVRLPLAIQGTLAGLYR